MSSKFKCQGLSSHHPCVLNQVYEREDFKCAISRELSYKNGHLNDGSIAENAMDVLKHLDESNRGPGQLVFKFCLPP